ncbi:MAG: spermidine/putrescine ABC transporter substrate-binding protein [Planctomycetota bacterium]|jgi:spermidine/putrescine transport system substrate-binding protein|nr:spermidine/putrescine ABC transporter substrate-binding protein [Planctomycetota bacterium]
MRRLWSGVLTVAVLCATSPLAAGADRDVLHVFTWSDYFDHGALAAFEDAFNCNVAIDLFDSNEAMYEEVVDGKYAYDIITPSSYMSSRMRKEGLLVELDHSLIPNILNIDPEFLHLTEDAHMRYSVPYTRTVSGIGYNARELPGLDDSWSVFADPRFGGRTTMLEDMRETIGAALKFLGYSLNTLDEGELAAAERLLQSWKRNLARFEIDEAHLGLASGELLAAHGYNGDVAQLMSSNPDIGFLVPREGSVITSDDFVIRAESKKLELAHAFINHMLDPRIAAMNMEGILYYMPNPAAIDMLPDEIRNNPTFDVSPDIIAKCEVIRDLGDGDAAYVGIWDAVTATD